MTLPYERTQAVIRTRNFLRELLDPQLRPRLPKALRQEAASLLKHYPSEVDMDMATNLRGQNPFGDLSKGWNHNLELGK